MWRGWMFYRFIIFMPYILAIQWWARPLFICSA